MRFDFVSLVYRGGDNFCETRGCAHIYKHDYCFRGWASEAVSISARTLVKHILLSVELVSRRGLVSLPIVSWLGGVSRRTVARFNLPISKAPRIEPVDLWKIGYVMGLPGIHGEVYERSLNLYCSLQGVRPAPRTPFLFLPEGRTDENGLAEG